MPSMIVATENAPIVETSAVPLAKYAQIVRIPECEFWGVRTPTTGDHECGTIFSLSDRLMLARYLGEAQLEMEKELNYFLNPKYVTGNLGTAYQLDEQPIKTRTLLTRWSRLIEMGRKVVVDMGNYAVDHTNDPATVGPIVADDYNEIHLYLPDTDSEIYPSAVTVGVGTVTFSVPRCRLVADPDNPSDGWDYADLTDFLSEVQVKRIYTDTENPIDLVRYHACNSHCSSTSCAEYTSATCGLIRDYNGGAIIVGTSGLSCGRYEYARLNYLSGLDPLDSQGEDAIIRLAHTKMPQKPCGCDYANFVWERDRREPEGYTVISRMNCPFGMMEGAWIAWRWTQVMKNTRILSLY